MTDQRITKINKAGRIGKIIAKIILVFMIISAVVTGAVGIAALAAPSDVVKIDVSGSAQVEISEKYLELGKNLISEVNKGMTEEGQILSLGGSEYEYASGSIDGDKVNIDYDKLGDKIGIRNFARFLLGTCLSLVNSAVLMFFVVALCNAIEVCKSPFDMGIIYRMKRLAIAFIPWIFVGGIATSICETAFGKFKLDMNIDLVTVLIALVLVVLIYVFQYGADLQRQSDETL